MAALYWARLAFLAGLLLVAGTLAWLSFQRGAQGGRDGRGRRGERQPPP